ncbi:hypothetical protein COCMIDRAFT_24709 [Bipolaris oryzae ATCC 44560]|uniref:Zn(2)-C6 fungal-type domain-containing protein n=1 Tax=Bipolaris oryzae ATCC 44560 TaxID=930090 RepID=W6ZUG5_COCMI|nr:uncharacterized protein COCMIDRAFT_24709 [Bipolaris oryzae ATCC 44560]EUC47386.1 hypothetical protein COCMIDRAFT_24709 [Bipolaris oryzae ATCC 44560]
MPADRTRGTNSQGRQRSCSECAKSKRKCGLEQPSCARCIRQRFSCIYPSQPHINATVPYSFTTDIDPTINQLNLPLDLTDLENINLDFNFDESAIVTTSNTDTLDFDFPANTTCITPFPAALQNSPHLENKIAIQKALTQARNYCLSINLSPYARARMGYFLEHMQLVPKIMVEQNCTPWMHPTLYDKNMPRCMQDAHATCALYITKNEINAERVTYHIRSRVEELIKETVPETPIEILARTQAIMLYQLMLVFGGDIHFRTQADALSSQLDDMGAMLLPIATEENEHVGALPLYPSTAAHSAWRSFVFRESARRTVLAAYQFTVMYTVLTGQIKTCSQDVALQSHITLSAHLWRATNAFDFAMSWNAKNHFVVKGLDFTNLLKEAQPDDLDVFGNILLISLQGIDDIRGWYHIRGGTLELP